MKFNGLHLCRSHCRLRLSTIPAAALVSALGFSSITYCLAYWRRVSILRSSSAVLLLRIGPTIISSLPSTTSSNSRTPR